MYTRSALKSLCIILLCICFNNLNAQELKWVYLPENSENGTSCTSTSNITDSTACFGLAYFPGFDGTVTSYTLGFIIDCNDGNNSVMSATSCVMDDNSTVLDDCAESDASLLFASGQNGNLGVMIGDSIILHQVCLEVGGGDSINVMLDDFTGVTISLDTPGGPVTDNPSTPSLVMITDSIFGFVPCDDSKVCSVNFSDSESRISFDLTTNNNVLEAASDTSLIDTLVVDIYDEINEICQQSGGEADATIIVEILNTQDQYGNAFLDTMAGEEHKLFQDGNGFKIDLPFNTSLNSESSTSDIRGVSITVDFELHIGIFADQFSLDLADVNSTGEIFESAAVIFYNELDIPYDTIEYTGYFQDSSDLSGNCNLNTIGEAWISTGDGIGSVFIDNTNRVDVNAPCNPTDGVIGIDTLSIKAVEDAGLDPTDYIGGFKVIFMGEDVASPSMTDDGSGIGGDDAIASNMLTSTSGTLQSSFFGYTVEGCVFNLIDLPVDLISFEVELQNKKPFLQWQTANEVNHSHFEVEWSRGGRNFSKVAEVDQSQRQFDIHHYKYTHDMNQEGVHYYRLKQVDLDGRFEYSEIRNVSTKGEENQQFMIYPNPAHESINIKSLSSVTDNVLIQIYSIEGKLVSQKNLDTDNTQSIVDVSFLSNGTYFIKLGQEVHRFVKL